MTPLHNGIGIYHATVGRDWIDSNGHLNVASYTHIFDQASDAPAEYAGLGEAYIREIPHSWVTLESHMIYHQEALLGDDLRVESRIVNVDAKKFHLCQELCRTHELLATLDSIGVHFDIAEQRSTPFAPGLLTGFEQLCEARAPDWIGRAVAFKRKRPPA